MLSHVSNYAVPRPAAREKFASWLSVPPTGRDASRERLFGDRSARRTTILLAWLDLAATMRDPPTRRRDWRRDFLAAPRRAVDCFETLYGRPIGASEYGLALAEAVGHLNRLLHAGEAVREPAPDGAWLWRRSRKGA
jgi:hypothetical protein